MALSTVAYIRFKLHKFLIVLASDSDLKKQSIASSDLDIFGSMFSHKDLFGGDFHFKHCNEWHVRAVYVGYHKVLGT